MSADHSPLPWSVGKAGRIIANNGLSVVRFNRSPNPALIVKAVNAHDDLVAALKEAHLQLVYLDSRFSTGTTPAVLARIYAALAKAAQS